MLYYYRVGDAQFQAVLAILMLIASTPGRKGSQQEHRLWKDVLPKKSEVAWLLEELAITFCGTALSIEYFRQYELLHASNLVMDKDLTTFVEIEHLFLL